MLPSRWEHGGAAGAGQAPVRDWQGSVHIPGRETAAIWCMYSTSLLTCFLLQLLKNQESNELLSNGWGGGGGMKKIEHPAALPISHLPNNILPDFSRPRQLLAMTAISSRWQGRSLEQPSLQNAMGRDVNREEPGAEAVCSGWASRYGARHGCWGCRSDGDGPSEMAAVRGVQDLAPGLG